jgi:hypothetical protein
MDHTPYARHGRLATRTPESDDLRAATAQRGPALSRPKSAFGAASTHCWSLTKLDASLSKLPLTPAMCHRLRPPCGRGTVSIRRWPAWLVRAPWASGVLDSARAAWDVRPASTDLAPPGRGRYRSSAGLPPEAGSSVVPHSAPPGVRLPGTRGGKTAGQCSFRWGERGDSNPRHPGPQQCCRGGEVTENPYLPRIPG